MYIIMLGTTTKLSNYAVLSFEIVVICALEIICLDL